MFHFSSVSPEVAIPNHTLMNGSVYVGFFLMFNLKIKIVTKKWVKKKGFSENETGHIGQTWQTRFVLTPYNLLSFYSNNFYHYCNCNYIVFVITDNILVIYRFIKIVTNSYLWVELIRFDIVLKTWLFQP